MAYPKTYEVTGPVPVNGTTPGGRFTVDKLPAWKHDPERLAFSEQAWVAGGLVKLVSEAKVKCPVCQEHGTAKEKKQEFTEKQLLDHHAKNHPGFEPPREG